MKTEPSFRILEIRTGLAAGPGTQAQTATDPGPIGIVGQVLRLRIFEGPGAAPVARQVAVGLRRLKVSKGEIARTLAVLPAVQATDEAAFDA